MSLKDFIVKLILVTLFCAVVIAVLNYFIPFFNSFQQFTWAALIYFFALTILAGYIGVRSLSKSAHGFVASVNGIVMLKLFLSAAFVIAYAIITKPHRPDFVISFFLLYVVYTVFLVREFIIAQKKSSLQKKNVG
jgi:peptidoglycan/LPS O-acetylase OafA/YrhL